MENQLRILDVNLRKQMTRDVPNTLHIWRLVLADHFIWIRVPKNLRSATFRFITASTMEKWRTLRGVRVQTIAEKHNHLDVPLRRAQRVKKLRLPLTLTFQVQV